MKPVIKVEKLTRTYQIPIKQGVMGSIFWPKYEKLIAVDKISFLIEPGEAVALLGPNGAGKTTTLKVLTGLLHPTSGKVEVLGYEPVLREEAYLKQIAMVMGNKNSMSWDLSSKQGFRLYQLIYELDEEEAKRNVTELAEILDVTNCLDRPIRKLSLGQRLKVELIGALLHKPKVLFLDEPTLGLDVIAKRNIREFLRLRNKKEGSNILLTSHDMADVEKVCERVMVINAGKLVYDGSIVNLMKKYQRSKFLTVNFEEPVKKTEIEQEYEVVNWGDKNLSVTLEVSKERLAHTITTLATNYIIDDIDIKQAPLEEVITDLFETTKS